ncbi:hypothetical protein LY78DRAFT_353793 [Colletotrichum sublineola]|nr:hypothetical protein LY78DRAFT_353793 [Colletotrichum sublineola]
MRRIEKPRAKASPYNTSTLAVFESGYKIIYLICSWIVLVSPVLLMQARGLRAAARLEPRPAKQGIVVRGLIIG